MPKLPFLKIITFFIVFIFPFFISEKVYAQDNFHSQLQVTYAFDNTGKSYINEDFTITNLTSKYLVSSYDYEIQGQIPTDISGKDSQGPLIIQSQKMSNGNTLIHVIFNEINAGKNQALKFSLFYTGPDVLIRNNSHEVRIPKLANPDLLDDYHLLITVPSDFGPLVYASSPSQSNLKKDGKYYISFKKDNLLDRDLNLIFSDYKSWGIRFEYQFFNSDNKSQTTRFSLPSDNPNQYVLISSINPKPSNIIFTPPSEWHAIYEIPGKTELSFKLTGQIQTKSEKPESFFGNTGIAPFNTSYFQDIYQPHLTNLSLNIKDPFQVFPMVNYSSYFSVTNTGNAALYNIPVIISSLGINTFLSQNTISALPPGGTVKIPFSYSVDFPDIFKSKSITVSAGASHLTYNMPARLFIIFYGVFTFISASVFIAIAYITGHAWGLHLQKRKSGNIRR